MLSTKALLAVADPFKCDPCRVTFQLVTLCLLVISADKRVGIGAGSWNCVTKTVIALFRWKRPSSIERNKEDADDMEEAETQNGESALVLLGVLISDVNAKASVFYLLSV